MGGTKFNNYKLLKSKLDHFLRNKIQVEIVTTIDKGVSELAEIYANQYKYSLKRFKHDFYKYGKGAKYRTNGRMIKYGDACVIFWDGNEETPKHMIETAEKKKTPLRVIKYHLVEEKSDD